MYRRALVHAGMGRPPYGLEGKRPQYLMRPSGNRYRQLPALGYERDRERAPLPLSSYYDANERAVNAGVQVEPRELSATGSTHSKSAPPADTMLFASQPQPQTLSQVQTQQPPLAPTQAPASYPPSSKNLLGYQPQPTRGMLANHRLLFCTPYLLVYSYTYEYRVDYYRIIVCYDL